jgi:hypothetical protein
MVEQEPSLRGDHYHLVMITAKVVKVGKVGKVGKGRTV